MKITQRLIYRLGMVSITAALGLISYLYYLAFWPIQVVTLNEPMKVIETHVHPGEDVTINLNFTKHKDITPTIKWSLVDGQYYPLLTANRTAPTGNSNTLTTKQIPTDAKPGTYHVEVRIDYEITSFRTISYTWVSNDFEIVE